MFAVPVGPVEPVTKSLDEKLQGEIKIAWFKKKSFALVKGSASIAAKFGMYGGSVNALLSPPLITYLGGSLWLIVPVGAATGFALHDVTVTELLKKYPNNELFLFLNRKIVKPGQIVCQYFANIGFTFSILSSLNNAVFQGALGVDYKKVVFPTLYTASVIPAGLISLSQYIVEHPKAKSPSYFRVLAEVTGRVSRFAASAGSVAILEFQGLINNDLSSAIIILSAVAGLISSVIEPSYPMVSFYMVLIMQLIGERLTLAMSVFSLINSIIAGYEVEKGSYGVPLGLFCTNLVFSALFYGILFAITPMKPRNQTINDVAMIEEADNEVPHCLVELVNEKPEDFEDQHEVYSNRSYGSLNS